MRRTSKHISITFKPPVLDDAAAVAIYNLLCSLVDCFDAHYGEQICRYYAVKDPSSPKKRPDRSPDDSPF